jgi:16S rRNA (cytosine967-C5)-methyltransferase
VEKWRANFSDDATLQLLEWNNTPPKTFARVNKLKLGTAALLDQWREEKVGFDAVARDWADDNLAFELQSHPPLAFLKSFTTGGFYIQDPSTLLAVRALDPQPGETILDLCAAPGGKTTFIAQLMNNTGKIIAHDTPERVKLITENCARLGVTNVEVTSTFNFQPATFNRILVDAPCSNTGVLRRRVDLRWRVTTEEIARLRATQVDLLALAATMLQPGGVLVYSTCSLEAEENSSVVQEFLTEHPGFKLASERQLTPFTDGVDGAFVARLEKIS